MFALRTVRRSANHRLPPGDAMDADIQEASYNGSYHEHQNEENTLVSGNDALQHFTHAILKFMHK